MKKLILSAILLLGTAPMANASPWPALDVDALFFSSQSVVEGTVVGEHKTTNPQFKPPLIFIDRADVKIEKTLLGADLTGKMVDVGDLSLYQKWTAMRFIEVKTPLPKPLGPETVNLETGDRAIFFLESAPSNPDLAAEKLTLGVWAPDSDARKKGISGFIQLNTAGGYGQMGGVSRAVFDVRFAASLARVAELKTKLAAPLDAKNRAFFLNWKKRREDYAKESLWPTNDAISDAVNKKLALMDARKEPQNGKSDG